MNKIGKPALRTVAEKINKANGIGEGMTCVQESYEAIKKVLKEQDKQHSERE